MSLRGRTRPKPIVIPPRKHVESTIVSPVSGGSLSPDLQPNSPPVFCSDGQAEKYSVSKIGNYLLTEPLDGENVYQAVHIVTQEKYICKIFSLQRYREALAAYWCVDSHENINQISEIILGQTNAYVFFEKNYGDLHTYVRDRRRIKESEAKKLFAQIVSAVQHCHNCGIILRDLKLRKFVFKNEQRTILKLEGLEDAWVLDDDDDDTLQDKHGCPAYVSPEILNANAPYSGKSADMWSLGVVLYTMLTGRYPFHDTEPSALFLKIRRGAYTIPDCVSSKARCLIKSLLRLDSSKRLNAKQVLQHPWFRTKTDFVFSAKHSTKDIDQAVPDVFLGEDDEDDEFEEDEANMFT